MKKKQSKAIILWTVGILLSIIFFVDDATVVGEALDLLEFMFMMVVGYNGANWLK